MPESVDRPAPERTRAPPSVSRSASVATPSTVVGTAVTGPSSLPGATGAVPVAGRGWRRLSASSPRSAGEDASSSGPGDRSLEAVQERLVDPGHALRREGAFEEAADAAGAGPRRPAADEAPAGVDPLHRPGGHHARVRIALHQAAVSPGSDDDVLLAHPLGGGLQPPVHPGAGSLPTRVDPVLAVLLGQHSGAGGGVVGERGADDLRRCPHDPFCGGDDLTHGNHPAEAARGALTIPGAAAPRSSTVGTSAARPPGTRAARSASRRHRPRRASAGPPGPSSR